jgi:Kef-type K+ transport system membrane component KefB
MMDALSLSQDLAWPVALLVAWLAGEFFNQTLRLPRISVYAVVGFVLAYSQTRFLPPGSSHSMLLLSNIAFGLILFECGYRFNLRWLKANPWMLVTSLVESALTFVLVFAVGLNGGLTEATAMLIAALAMATSPATVMRVIHEVRGAGQVSERLLHLSALNCVLAVFVYKVLLGVHIFQVSGNWLDAVYGSLIVLGASVLLGGAMGVLMPAVLRQLRRQQGHTTMAFGLAVVLLVTLTLALKLSPILASLTFGLVARERRWVMDSAQRGFGALGDLLALVLFVYIASTLQWNQVVQGLGLGLALILARQVAKVLTLTAFAFPSGLNWRKGFMVGMASAPISAFAILALEQSRHLGIAFVDQLAPLTMMAFTLEVLGPLMVRLALQWSHETHEV